MADENTTANMENDESMEDVATDQPNFQLEFENINEEDVNEFLDQNFESKNTRSKTKSDIKKVQRFLNFKNEERNIELIPHQELDEYLKQFIVCARKQDGGEYEPVSLRSIVGSVDRHLRNVDYGMSIINKSGNFPKTVKALRSKLKDLKSKGKGNRPHASDPLEDEDIQKIVDSDALGVDSNTSLLNLLLYNNMMHFGMRARKSHYQLLWGDVDLKESNGERYLCLTERKTKNRSGDDLRKMKRTLPKAFENKDSPLCPVRAYEVFSLNRPEMMRRDDAPFYIQPNFSRQLKFKAQRVGENKLGKIVGNMCKSAGVNDSDEPRKLTNSSVRKTLVQKIRDTNIPSTDGCVITGHRNPISFEDYAPLPTKKHMAISNMLSDMGNKENHTVTSDEASVPPIYQNLNNPYQNRRRPTAALGRPPSSETTSRSSAIPSTVLQLSSQHTFLQTTDQTQRIFAQEDIATQGVVVEPVHTGSDQIDPPVSTFSVSVPVVRGQRLPSIIDIPDVRVGDNGLRSTGNQSDDSNQNFFAMFYGATITNLNIIRK